MLKKCAALRDKRICNRQFEDTEGFLTCPSCRVYLPSHSLSGGCSKWAYASADPKVTKQYDQSAHIERVV